MYTLHFYNTIMAKLKIRGNDLKKAGVTSGPLAGLAVAIAKKHYQMADYDRFLNELTLVSKKPEDFTDNVIWATYASKLMADLKVEEINKEIPLNEKPAPYKIWGKSKIEAGAINQMDIAVHLPVTHSGALMPDAHQGYGLPIGGVLGVENAVIPYGVGMDIGCRMCLSIYPLSEGYLKEKSYDLKKMVQENSRFGKKIFDNPNDAEVLQRKEFKEIPIVKRLKDKAYRQMGSSGSGNHFVEFGVTEILDPSNEMGLPLGKYMALLTHSGSRGLGANIAQHYTQIAMQKTRLPKQAKHLAWLSLDSQEGMEYWLAMNLAGDYASACHHDIHNRIAASLGEQPLAMVENHHNFAWKEKAADGTELIVHRKGATPAGKGVLGIIPGSMTEPGFIVRGKGDESSLNSASHGAGRKMSRTRAKSSFTKKDLRKVVSKAGVSLIGGGLDEIPGAYKDIHEVMGFQKDLVDVLGTFMPKIVRMDKG